MYIHVESGEITGAYLLTVFSLTRTIQHVTTMHDHYSHNHCHTRMMLHVTLGSQSLHIHTRTHTKFKFVESGTCTQQSPMTDEDLHAYLIRRPCDIGNCSWKQDCGLCGWTNNIMVAILLHGASGRHLASGRYLASGSQF